MTTSPRSSPNVETGAAKSDWKRALSTGSSLRPPGIGRLWLAALFDATVGLSAWALCALALLKLLKIPGDPFNLPRGILPALLALAVLLHLAYHVFCVGRFGQTLGKSAMDVAVVRRDGAPAGYSRALLRSLGGLASLLTLGLANLGMVMSPDMRGAGDRLAGTRVVRVPKS
jgi:uncharacterized RDD family membrane protein YckC